DSFLLEQQPQVLEYLQKQLDDGAIMEKSVTFGHLQTKEELTSLLKKLAKKKLALSETQIQSLKKMFVIAEFLQQNKKTILKDKLLLWLTNSPDFQYIKTSDQVLTSRGDHFYYFWNKRRKDLYDRLPFPQKIDCVDLHSNSLNGFSNEMMLNSWFSTRKIQHPNKSLQEISLPSCKFLAVDGMVNEDIKSSKKNETQTTMKCRKYKLKKVPLEARKIFQKWKGLYNFAYNRSVWMFNESSEIFLDSDLRDCIKSNDQWCRLPFMLDLPTELREGASNECSKNATAAFTNLSNGNINHFNLKFRKRKESFTINGFQKRSLKFTNIKGNISRRIFRLLPSYCPFALESCKDLPEITNDFCLHFDGEDYYLLLPFEEELKTRIETGNVIALDPGVRTFQTGFSNSGDSLEFCTSNSVARLHSLAINLDRLISRRAKKGEKRRILSKQIIKLRKKLKNLQIEMHYKVANKLTKENDIIILPSFETKGMTKKANRKLRTKTVRQMSLLAHSSFKELLKTKAIERGSRILICEE